MMKKGEMNRTEERVEKVEKKNEEKTNVALPQVEIEESDKLIKEDKPQLINENEKETMEHKKEKVKQSESNDQVEKENHEVLESESKVSPNEEDHIQKFLKEMGLNEDLIRKAILIVGNDIGEVIEMLM
jgi:hypothetical protein